jgi:amino acid permease
MTETISSQTERLAHYSRRQLWSVLFILLLVGVAMLVDMLFTVRLPAAVIIPIAIVAAFARPLSTKGLDFSKSNPAVQALRNDELRQFAQAKAFRNGFFVLLAYPPICAYMLTWLTVANPLPIVVESGAWLGAVVALASLLWYDR